MERISLFERTTFKIIRYTNRKYITMWFMIDSCYLFLSYQWLKDCWEYKSGKYSAKNIEEWKEWGKYGKHIHVKIY